MAGEVLQVALRLGIGMAGVVRYHGASHGSVSFGKAGSAWLLRFVVVWWTTT